MPFAGSRYGVLWQTVNYCSGLSLTELLLGAREGGGGGIK